MTFSDVAYKNFKAHIRKYMSYFLCSSFAIMVFFMYMTLVFNNEIMDYSRKNKADLIFVMIVTVITVFSIFFINYSHFSFIKSRSREFGLYLTLGMNKNDIGRIILIENTLIAAFSMIVGILMGTVFSRLFFMAVVKILNLTEIPYILDLRPFISTLLTFTAIFACVIAISRITIRKLEISELLKQERKKQGGKLNHPAWGIAGVLMMITYLAGIIFMGANGISNFILMELLLIISFIGMYFVLSNLGNLLVGFVRKNKNVYYKNIIGITEINYKFNQNKNIVFIISVLSAVIVCMMSMPVSMYPQMENISEKMMFSDLQFVQKGDINKISSEKLDHFLNSGESSVVAHDVLEFVNVNMINKDKVSSKLVASETQYKKATGREIQVGEGSAVNVRYNTFSGRPILPERQIKLTVDGEISTFSLQDEFSDNLIGMKSCPADSLLILNDKDYDLIKSGAKQPNMGVIHLVNFKDWHKMNGVYEKLAGYLKASNSDPMAVYYEPVSRNEFYNGIKNIYSMFLFVTSFSAVLFFIASVCVLFFKQYTEIEDTRRKYRKLFKIGICRKEAMMLISAEMKLTYFLPVLLGFIIGYPLLYAESGIFMDFYHAESLRDSLMPNALWVVAAYLVFQTVFYITTRRKYTQEVIGNI